MEEYRSFQDNKGRRWSVDWDAALRVIRSYHRSEALLTAARIASCQEEPFLPKVHSVVVDWERVRQRTDQESTRDYGRWSALAAVSIDDAMKELREMQTRTVAYNAMFRDVQAEAQRRTTASIEANVEVGSKMLGVLKGLREAGAGVLLAGTTILSGGVAAAAGAGGMAIDGAGRFQDLKVEHKVSFSTAVGSSILQVTADVTFGIVPGKLAGAGHVEKIVVKFAIAKLRTGVGIAQSLLEGDTVKQASGRALAQRGLDLVLEGLPLSKWAIPARIGLTHGGGVGRVVSVHRVGEAVVGVATGKIAGTAASFMGRVVEVDKKTPPAPLTTLPVDGQCNADAAVCDPGFLDSAFICLPR